MNSKNKILISLGCLTLTGLVGSVSFVACTADITVNPIPDSGPYDSALPDTGGGDAGDAGFPAPPALGTQIDRLGRPAVNTAGNNVFEADAAVSGPAKDGYNANSDPSTWVATYTGEAAKNVAIFDSMDTVCGNQFLAVTPDGGLGTAAGTYNTLAGVLADDRLYTDTSATTCACAAPGGYLAVEGAATGLVPNTDCGGRRLDCDVMDKTYSILTIGALSGVTDGIGADTSKTGGTTFPYLAPAK
jgi:hypothetical protein